MSQFLEFNIPGCSLSEELNNILPQQVACVCCLTQQEPYVNLTTCVHLSFLECFFKFKMEVSINVLICLQCHSMLKKIEDFKRQVERSVQILNNQVLEIKSDAPKLQRSVIETTDYTEPRLDDNIEGAQFSDNLNVPFKQEQIHTCEVTEIKIEHDFSDVDIDVPLAEVKRQGEDCNERLKKKVKPKKSKIKEAINETDKYEGKIRTLILNKEALFHEREMLKMDQKYLRLPYKCEDCIVSFEFEMAWTSHKEKQHTKKESGHTCDICKSVLSSASSFKEHSRRHLRRFECSVCGKRYHDEYSAVQHYNELHGITGAIAVQFQCEECDFVSNSHRSYRYHRSKHRQDKHPCTICGNLFASASNLKIHMYTVHKQSTRVFQCEPCGKVYKGKSGLFTHMTTAHGTCDRRAYCADCRTYYRTAQSLAHHLRTHSSHIAEHDNRYVCDECNAKFITKANLKNHIEWEHLGIRKHRCSKCSKAFRRKTSLTKHIQFVHEKKRPPRDKICDYCGHGFTTQAILNSHIRTHTGERPHRCTHCSATFAHSSALYNHNKLLHNPHRIK